MTRRLEDSEDEKLDLQQHLPTVPTNQVHAPAGSQSVSLEWTQDVSLSNIEFHPNNQHTLVASEAFHDNQELEAFNATPRPHRVIKQPRRYSPADYESTRCFALDNHIDVITTYQDINIPFQEETILVGDDVDAAFQDISTPLEGGIIPIAPLLPLENQVDENVSNQDISQPTNGNVVVSQENGDGVVVSQENGDGIRPREVRVIELHRNNIRKDLIKYFSDPTIMNDDLDMHMIDQKGERETGRGSGLIRDIYSTFWMDAYDSLMVGEEERVPFIRHDFQRDQWEAIGRILLKGFLSCQYFPLCLSKSFMVHNLFGESFVSREMLNQSFKYYISKSERGIFEKCLLNEDFDEGNEEVLDFLSNFECKRLVTKDNIVDILREIAQKELIQKPQYVSHCWKDVCTRLGTFFPTLSSLEDLYSDLSPDCSKLIARIHADPINDAQRESLKHLKRYIRGLDASKLAKFLRFISGSDLLLFDAFQVLFSNLDGLERRPVAHTCNFMLELPCTYQSFPELREEFNHILEANTWAMDII